MDRVSKAERELVRKIQKQTNADRIRAMTDEDLAKWFEGLAPSSGWRFFLKGNKWLDWLKQEAENES